MDQTSDKINRSSVVKAISEIFRILRKGGRVILTVPCTDGKVEDYTRTCKIYNPRTIFESVKGFTFMSMVCGEAANGHTLRNISDFIATKLRQIVSKAAFYSVFCWRNDLSFKAQKFCL